LAYGAAGEEVEGFEGGDEELEEFDGGAEGCGEGVEGRREFAMGGDRASARRFPTLRGIENAGFHAIKYAKDFK
jgi:hypothetical protein